MEKLSVSEMRGLESQVSKGEISYSRMVEIINEKFANQFTPVSDGDEVSDKDLHNIMGQFYFHHEELKDSDRIGVQESYMKYGNLIRNLFKTAK